MNKLKIGILGGSRGMDFAMRMLLDYEFAEIAAVCETYPVLLEKCRLLLHAQTEFGKGLLGEGFDLDSSHSNISFTVAITPRSATITASIPAPLMSRKNAQSSGYSLP